MHLKMPFIFLYVLFFKQAKSCFFYVYNEMNILAFFSFLNKRHFLFLKKRSIMYFILNEKRIVFFILK